MKRKPSTLNQSICFSKEFTREVSQEQASNNASKINGPNSPETSDSLRSSREFDSSVEKSKSSKKKAFSFFSTIATFSIEKIQAAQIKTIIQLSNSLMEIKRKVELLHWSKNLEKIIQIRQIVQLT